MTLPEELLTSTNEQHARQRIESVFDDMLMTYGKRFVDQWSGPDPDALLKHWEMKLAGYSDAEIERGKAALAGRDWPPTLPEFQRLCRPPIDPYVAYYEALRGLQARKMGRLGHWSHPAIYWAAIDMAFDLESQTHAQIKARWEMALIAQIGRGQWATIPKPTLALSYNGKRRERSKAADEALKELGAQGITRSVIHYPQKDPLRWAVNIMERAERGNDPHITLTVIEMARSALGIR